MLAHNRHDILSLAALTAGYGAVALPRAGTFGRRARRARPALGSRWTSNGASPAIRGARHGAGEPRTGAVLLRLATVEKRFARWDVACSFWEAAIAALAGSTRAPGRRSPKSTSTVAAIYGRPSPGGNPTQGRQHAAPEHVLANFTHRLNRLTRRLSPKEAAS